jgi:hypothetical protein
MDGPSERTLEATLELVPNDLDKKIHARLDKEVLELAKEPTDPYSACLLIIVIIQTSGALLDASYKEVKALKVLLQKHPGLMTELRKAWTSGSFEGIRNLSTYNPVTRSLGSR